MKTRIIIILLAIALILSFAGYVFPTHVEEKGVTKGSIIKIETSEVEVTVKDEKGTEKKIKTRDTSFKTGDHVIIKDGKLIKEVKPITGGY